MIYCIDPNDDEPIMLIDKHIGFDDVDGMGISGSTFQQELLQLDTMGKKRIQVWINSPGGNIMEGYNIYNAILKSKTKVDTYCVGIAASIAAVIFQAGRNRIMVDYGVLMYHNPYGADKDTLGAMKDSLATMISRRTGKSIDEVNAAMDRTTWISATEAKQMNFCDVIENSSEQNKKRATAAAESPMAMHRAMNSILTETLNKQQSQPMKKVTNKLGLVEAANEDQILDAIDKLEVKLTEASNKASNIANELKTAQDKATDLQTKLDEANNKLAAEKKAKEDAEAAQKATEAKNYFDGAAKIGRIKADAVNEWCETAANIGFDKAKSLVEAIPMSKAAAKIEVSGAANEAQLTNVVAVTMAENRNKIEDK